MVSTSHQAVSRPSLFAGLPGHERIDPCTPEPDRAPDQRGGSQLPMSKRETTKHCLQGPSIMRLTDTKSVASACSKPRS